MNEVESKYVFFLKTSLIKVQELYHSYIQYLICICQWIIYGFRVIWPILDTFGYICITVDTKTYNKLL